MKLKERSVRDILNRLRWDESFEFSKVRVVYADRISGNSEFSGDEIEDIGHKFIFLAGDVMIPIHRIVEIKYSEKTLWRKLKNEEE